MQRPVGDSENAMSAMYNPSAAVVPVTSCLT